MIWIAASSRGSDDGIRTKCFVSFLHGWMDGWMRGIIGPNTIIIIKMWRREWMGKSTTKQNNIKAGNIKIWPHVLSGNGMEWCKN
jgi:hypothetical protein